ncbi:DUF418 domain-containing protein [Streptomyces cyaneofuscatus]|uniref:DUF418 domain-containing protein n=1 Tax=Streptomyces cyaneofuscatus TaxID=66883 RepID=A0ABZ1EUP8_9ACTN|nr:DUF418 domain-containing protein [Streptomyces cyaneofuscatus]WSB07807.1 DUF418 domain-containing protein [Streptomyces cyaneofuscatus]WSD48660.1 DUF418 domain-containing protein [Streptomyces cyaneofuscatus]
MKRPETAESPAATGTGAAGGAAAGTAGGATAGTAGGVPRPHRIVEVDALRGFALCGIFLANVLVMSGIDGLRDGGAGPTASGLDQVAHWLVVALVQTKFYLLFSFLFGYSFTLQMDAAERDVAPFAPRMLRRLLGLFVLGALHAVLLYPGDILTTYAVLGLILLAARAVDPARMWRAALWVYGVVAGLYLLLGLAVALVDTGEGDEGLAASAAELAAAYRGGPADVVRANMDAWSDILAGLLMMGGMVVAAFLAGFVAGRRRLLAGTDSPARATRLRRICLWGLVVGLPGGALMAAGTVGPLGARWQIPTFILGMLTAPALSAAYASGLLLWFTTPRGARLAARLAPAGRMALTNYLVQSLVMALVFTGYGAALYGRVGAAAALGGALLFYGFQLVGSARLMKHHRLGPVERLLRAVTLWGRPTPRA